jgi:dihydrofolate reductase
MRDVIVFDAITLDGFFEGPDNDLSWHRVDDEFNDFAWEQIKGCDAILFGRKTYELMASFWPSAEALKEDPITADLMNTWPKIVFSQTLKEAAWNNTRLAYGIAVDGQTIDHLRQRQSVRRSHLGRSD